MHTLRHFYASVLIDAGVAADLTSIASLNTRGSDRVELLGYLQCADQRRNVAERRIPFVKWGHLLRFDPAEIEAWLTAWRVSVER